MDNTTTIEIKGVTLEVTCMPFEPVTQYQLLAKVGKVLVPTVLAAQAIDPTKAKISDLMPAVDKLFDGLTPQLADEFRRDCLRGCTVQREDDSGKPERIDLVNDKAVNKAFRGLGVKPMLMCIKHVLEVNFGDFFAVSDRAELAETAPAPSP